MNHLKSIRFTAYTAAAAILMLAFTARADDMIRYRARPIGSTVSINGKANVHDWTMTGSIIGGYLEIPAGTVIDSAQVGIAGLPDDGKLKATAEVGIPISSIKNIHGYEGMDEVMQDAMNAATYPRIVYHVTSLTLKQPHAAGTPFQFDTAGELSFNNVTNKISMPITIESVDKTKLKIIGKDVPVSMTDFNVKPPVKLGIFTTEANVKISFEWIVAESKPAESK